MSIIGGTMQKNGVGGYGATALQFSNGDTIDFKLQAASSPTTPTTVTATIAQGGDTLSWTIWTT